MENKNPINASSNSHTLKDAGLETLSRYFGYSSFRPGQWEVIESIIGGRDTVVLMPTGGGKSLCFQIPALMSKGCCIVVSPLIALMNDQVTALQANGIPAAAVNSNRPETDNQEAYCRAASGELKLLYLSPERLLVDIVRIKEQIPVSFIAVDEAHCISQWGHDFRPVYTSLTLLKNIWPDIPVMALTATADRITRDDIARALGLENPFMYVGSFDRPNLSLRVIQGASLSDRIKVISSLIERHPMDCGIVYCLSRKKTESMAHYLSDAGYRVGFYHAGMTAEDRESVQQDFVAGRLQAICATIAFGMGIDKSNIRWVVHNNLPGNIESYYQEIGRAGRDGLPAETILFYSFSDVMARRKFVEESGQREINESKLDFMQKYAEAHVCRRRILLSYFSEDNSHDCGNCDNCRTPRRKIDGTVLAQKALSAIIRTGNSESVGTIVEILRGMRPQYLLSKGYDRLPTFGVGADLPAKVWQAYILQMQQLGLIEVAYDDNFHLRPTEAGWRVVKGEERIALAQYTEATNEYTRRKSRSSSTVKTPRSMEENLADALKAMRVKISERTKIADYMIISDATIADLAKKRPSTVEQLIGVEGMSMAKIWLYYKDILSTIRYVLEKKRSLPPRSSDIVTRLMFGNDMTLDEIAALRGLKESTVFGHLVGEYVAGHYIDLERLLPTAVFERICVLLEKADAARGSGETPEEQEAYRSELEKLRDHLEEYGITAEELQRTLTLRRSVETVNGSYRPIPIVNEPEAPYGEMNAETPPYPTEEDWPTDLSFVTEDYDDYDGYDDYDWDV
ncbi:MAG: DNA helicase RecQ [Bacteroides sp.]|nr:DNA helicase RecQ [Bacteroides sp.]